MDGVFVTIIVPPISMAITFPVFIVLCRDVAGGDLLRDGLAVGGDLRLL
jgi:hypothetical protein